LRQEEIIEPELEIVDPHHHLWDRPGNRRPITRRRRQRSQDH
jgi:predicted TIM-barrel fold metal-dependent hydrolase